MERHPPREGKGRRTTGLEPQNAPAQSSSGARDYTTSGGSQPFAFAMADMNEVRPQANDEQDYHIQGSARSDIDTHHLPQPRDYVELDVNTPHTREERTLLRHEAEHRGIVRYNAGPTIPDARVMSPTQRSEVRTPQLPRITRWRNSTQT